MKKPWVLSYPLSAQRKLIRLGGCPGWAESSLGAQSLCCFCHEAAQVISVSTPLFASLDNVIVGFFVCCLVVTIWFMIYDKTWWFWFWDCEFSKLAVWRCSQKVVKLWKQKTKKKVKNVKLLMLHIYLFSDNIWCYTFYMCNAIDFSFVTV